MELREEQRVRGHASRRWVFDVCGVVMTDPFRSAERPRRRVEFTAVGTPLPVAQRLSTRRRVIRQHAMCTGRSCRRSSRARRRTAPRCPACRRSARRCARRRSTWWRCASRSVTRRAWRERVLRERIRGTGRGWRRRWSSGIRSRCARSSPSCRPRCGPASGRCRTGSATVRRSSGRTRQRSRRSARGGSMSGTRRRSSMPAPRSIRSTAPSTRR